MRNLHKLYYKDYYNDVTFSLNDRGFVESVGNPIDIVKESDVKLHPDFLCGIYGSLYHKSEFEVLYPGLLTGVGISHNTRIKKLKGEFKLGMHFDYTYGFPIVYGSSVKGVLKEYFKDCYKSRKDIDIDALIADIFDGISYETRKPKPVYARDQFLDAIVISSNNKGRILESDALAPHGGPAHNDPFVEPVPIPFIKIASGVKLRFRFKLHTTKDKTGVIMSAEEKLKVFNEILETFGIGAKTNVGYGQLKCLTNQD